MVITMNNLIDSDTKQLVEAFESYMSNYFAKFEDSRTLKAMKYSLLAKGKRVRPLILFKCLQDYNVDPVIGFSYALAIEMIHTYSLIHDDLPSMDNDTLRRGVNTCHIEFDEATAILAGDALLTQAFDCINEDIEDKKNIKIIKYLVEYAGVNGMILGQERDLLAENDNIIDEDGLIAIHSYKTGKLLTLPIIIASIIANKEDSIENAIKLGNLIGLTFQIQDDILDITGDELSLGKNAGSDIEQNKSTYVSVLGILQAKELVISYTNHAKYILKDLNISKGRLETYIEELMNRRS